jgi:hypothetical protein
VTDGAPSHEAHAHGIGGRAPQAVAGERFGIGIVCVRGLLHQAERLTVSPGVQVVAAAATIEKPRPKRGAHRGTPRAQRTRQAPVSRGQDGSTESAVEKAD